jgi:hypothetical protein
VLSRSLSPIRTWALLLAALVAVCGSLALRPAAAGAAPAPSQTQLTLDPLLIAGLKVAGVKLRPLGPATIGSGGLYFPVGRQNMNAQFLGTARHTGGFELLVGDLRIGFRNFIITTKAGSPATGTLSGEPVINGRAVALQFPISKIVVGSALLNQNLLIGRTKLEIDRNIVSIINKTLKIQVIKPGQSWATTETRLPWASTALPAS